MWKCRQCSEVIEDEFDECWNCQTARQGGAYAPVPDASDAPPAPVPSPAAATIGNDVPPPRVDAVFPEPVAGGVLANPPSLNAPKILRRRYADAYASARVLLLLGNILKWTAAFAALSILASCLANIGPFAGKDLADIGIEAVVGGIAMFVSGVLLAGLGQTQMAIVDTAVNACRLLSVDEIEMMIFRQK